MTTNPREVPAVRTTSPNEARAREPHAEALSADAWLPTKTTVGAAAGTFAGVTIAPQLLERAARLPYTNHWIFGGDGVLGTKLIGEGTRAAALTTEMPRLNTARAFAEGGLNSVAPTLKQIATGLNDAKGAVTTGADLWTVRGLTGDIRSAAITAENAGAFLRSPVGRAGTAGAAIGVGQLLDQHTPGRDSYHLAVPATTLALTMPGESLGTRVAIGLGGLVVGKVLNEIAPPSAHLEEILRPGMADTALLMAAVSMPKNQVAFGLGAWTVGRMAHMNSTESLGTAALLGVGTFAATKNAPLSVAVGAGSYATSRVMNWIG